MSDLAIAAVTATIRGMLENGFKQANLTGEVTTLPLDKAAVGTQPNRLNLFLYYMAPNAAWRNQTIPNKVKRGETGYPPLALNLYYMLTAYGDDQVTEADHRLLGMGMRILHDKSVLDAQDISNATSEAPLNGAKLENQFEQVKLTLEPLTLEEMSKLWTTFQTQYRISAAFQASVILIESKRQVKSPLPVLARGEDDQGVDIIPTMPGVLEGIEYRDLRQQLSALPAAQLGDVITIQGRNLPGTRCRVLFIDPTIKQTQANPEANIVAAVTPEAGSDDAKIFVKLDPNQPNWLAGPLQVQLQDLPQPGRKRPSRSNALRIGLAPSLLVNDEMPLQRIDNQLVLSCTPPISVITDPTGNTPAKWPEVTLLLSPLAGAQTIPPRPLNQASQFNNPRRPVFDVTGVPQGSYRVRLRIETVESLLMRRNGNILEFDERQVVQL